MVAGIVAVMTGGVVSSLIVTDPVATLPATSVTLMATVYMPSAPSVAEAEVV